MGRLYGPPIPGAISPVPATDAMTKPVGIRDMKLFTEYDVDPDWKSGVDDDLADLDGRLDTVEGTVSNHETRIDTIEDDLNHVSTGIKDRLATAEQDIDGLEYDVHNAQSDITDLQNDKLDIPTNAGSTGDVIVKTATGTEYQAVAPFNPNRDYPNLSVGYAREAKAIENISENSGDTQNTPFIFQGTATENNTTSTPSGSVATVKKVIGHTVVYNQLCDGVNDTYPTISGRKYWVYIASTNSYTIVTSAGTSIVLDDPQTDYIVDLTLWFSNNNNIPADLLAHPEIFRTSYYTGSMDYDTGSFKTQNIQEILTRGFNQWNEEWRTGSYSTTDGTYQSGTNVCNKYPIRVIPGQTYYFRFDQTTPSPYMWILLYDINLNFLGYVGANNHTRTFGNNVAYINFYMNTDYGTTYLNDICINLHWDGARDGEYEAYVENTYSFSPPANPLLGIYTDGDEWTSATPSNNITRKYAMVDLGSLTWYTTTVGTKTTMSTNFSSAPHNSTTVTVLCPKYVGSNDVFSSDSTKDKIISTNYVGNLLYVYDSDYNDATAFTSAMSGVYLIYELATPTTETGNAFTSLIEVDDYGTMETIGDYYIPTKLEIFYPANYVALVDDLGNYTDYDVTKLMKIPTLPVADGNYKLRLVMASGTPTFSWVSE